MEQARLVAWLRRLGMPLAQIGAVLDAAPAEAAMLVAAFIRGSPGTALLALGTPGPKRIGG